mmetsp:Transcript_1300/g.3925  ORF Transcript_1300/g.3925 Transcript_1300/m.3925 type:complete len:82 (-) Transcript_1300:700-945(-)
MPPSVDSSKSMTMEIQIHLPLFRLWMEVPKDFQDKLVSYCHESLVALNVPWMPFPHRKIFPCVPLQKHPVVRNIASPMPPF